MAEEFTEKLRVAMEQQLVLGDPTQPGVTVGPLINASQHSKVCDMVSSSLTMGAQLVMGGGPSEVSPLHYQPTILTEVTTATSLPSLLHVISEHNIQLSVQIQNSTSKNSSVQVHT